MKVTNGAVAGVLSAFAFGTYYFTINRLQQTVPKDEFSDKVLAKDAGK